MAQVEEIDFEADAFSDILSRDARYEARAYALLSAVIQKLGEGGRSFSGEDVLEEFKETALDQYGPLAYTVLDAWGVRRCEDVGEMMFNLAESGRVGKGEDNTAESFAGGYDFKEAFLGPYAI
jgi:uncharacterized repeat protein (TIGR04138 family)